MKTGAPNHVGWLQNASIRQKWEPISEALHTGNTFDTAGRKIFLLYSDQWTSLRQHPKGVFTVSRR